MAGFVRVCVIFAFDFFLERGGRRGGLFLWIDWQFGDCGDEPLVEELLLLFPIAITIAKAKMLDCFQIVSCFNGLLCVLYQ